jgi:primosomal protein N' (replication factor Y)
VDLRAELKAGNRSIFSRPLQAAVDGALAAGEQVILFLNRRGTATHLFCRDCGWVANCPRCDAPLTYHAGSASLICHRCGYHRPMVQRCPQCGSTRVKPFGLGTEGLLAKVAERWPKARLLRWDQDVARTHRDHAALLGRFAAGEAEILVGTQMVARGLDLPNVTVVGVVSADVGLHLPDFRAAERTFQLLAQVAGRAGRGLRGGRVIIQTYHPQHYVIRFAAAHDYEGFARHELAFRREAIYPPYIRLARLLFRHSRAERAQAEAERMGRLLRDRVEAAGLPTTTLIGPAPAFFYRRRGRYRWQIIVRHFDPADFLRGVDFPPGWQVEIDPIDLL